MITLMRRYRRALQIGLLLVVAAFVASLFVFGTRGDGSVSRDGVASVNGEAIPLERYHRRYREFLNAYTQVMRGRFSPEMAERFGLGQQVIEDLVQEALIVQRARTEGLATTDDELNAQIQAIPAFQENGRFTVKRYDEVLKRLGYTKVGFEDEMRRRLTRTKVESVVRAGVKISDAEVEQAFVHNREEVRVAWALVELAPLLTAVTTTDEDLAAYLKSRGDEFRQPERRRVQYVALSPKDFTSPVTEAEVEKYYSEHGTEFEEPRQVRAAHILVRVPETGGSEAEDQARTKVAEAIRRAKAGEDFATLARELSQDPASASRGGELGFVGKGELVAPFEQAMLGLRKGEITAEPVRTSFGFHAIKALEIREGGKKPLKQVATQIRERLQGDAADRAARAKADEVRAKLLGASDFLGEARKLGLAPVETTIPRREGIPGLMPSDPLEETAFSLAQSGVSTPVKTPAGWIVLKSVQALPAAVPPLEDVKDQVKSAFRRDKADALALEKAKQLVADAKGGDLAAAARKAGATLGETSRFSRAKPAEKLPGDAMLAGLKTPVGSISDPIKTQPGYYVLKVLERVPPDLGPLTAERDKIATELLTRKQSQAWQAWLTAARARAKIDMTSRPPAARRS